MQFDIGVWKDPEPSPPGQTTSLSTKKTALGYVNLGLPSHFDIDDNEMNWSDNSLNMQNVEQEYYPYVLGNKSWLDVDLLKFWEVCDNFEFWFLGLTQCFTVSPGWVSNNLCHCSWLPTDPSFCCPMWMGIFIKHWNWHSSSQSD